MREQEVDEGRIELHQGVQDRVGVVLDVDRAQQPEIEVAVSLLPEQLHGLEYERVTGAPVREAAVPVVGSPVTVEGDTDLHVELVEEIEIPGAELDAVGVDPEVQLSDTVQGRCQLLADAAQACRAYQERLASVQDH